MIKELRAITKNKEKSITKNKITKAIIATYFTIIFNIQTVFAGGIADSKFVTGTQKMMEDATNALIILAPIITVFVVGYCFIRKGAADEHDHKKWDTRVTTAIVSCIGVVSASLIVKVVMEYYSV